MFLGSRWVAPKLATAALASTLLLAGISEAAADPVSPAGIWYTDGAESIIKVHSCASEADAYCGTIVWLKEPKESETTGVVERRAGAEVDPVHQTDHDILPN